MAKERKVKVRAKILAFAILSILVFSIVVAFATDYPTAIIEKFGVEIWDVDTDPKYIVETGGAEIEDVDNAPVYAAELYGVQVWNSGDNVTGYASSSNVGNGDVDNGYSVACYSYWYTKEGGVNLDGYFFSNNATGTYSNSSWTTFGATNNTWANTTINLNGDIGDVVGYLWYANTSASKWNSTALQHFTVSATITFVKSAGVTMYRDGGVVTNGTETTYSVPTTLNLTAVVSQGYEFDYWAWYAGTETSEELTVMWTPNITTSVYLYAIPLVPSIPEPPIIPPITGDYETLFFYYHSYAFEINNVTGFAMLITPPNSPQSWEVTTSGSANISWGARVWVDYATTSYELTSGSPILLGTLTGENATLLSADFPIAERGLTFAGGDLKVIVYSRWDAGSWDPTIVFVSDYLYYTRIMASNATLQLYATRTESEGLTLSSAYWGTSTYLSGIDGVTFKVARGYDWQSYYLSQGNLLSFLSAPYTAYLGNGIYAIVLFGVGMSLYIRYRTMSVVALLIVFLGGAGGVINMVVGELFLGAIWIAAAFGIALVYWRVFR